MSSLGATGGNYDSQLAGVVVCYVLLFVLCFDMCSCVGFVCLMFVCRFVFSFIVLQVFLQQTRFLESCLLKN